MSATHYEIDPDREVRPARPAFDPFHRPGVLLAVDDLPTRLKLATYLRGRGFDVWTAGSGMDAFDVYFEHTGAVGVLVIDAGFRDLPGPAFLKRFKAFFPGVPCVFLIDPDGDGAELAAAGAATLARAVLPADLSKRLWEIVASAE